MTVLLWAEVGWYACISPKETDVDFEIFYSKDLKQKINLQNCYLKENKS